MVSLLRLLRKGAEVANKIEGEMATCACGQVGGIVGRSKPLAVKARWFIIRHEHEDHVVEVFDDGTGTWRFRMMEET